MRNSGLVCCALTVAGLLPALSLAQRPAYAPTAEARPLSPPQRLERRYLQITAANLRFQGEASRLALARSANVAVKELAQNVVARQKTVQPELMHLLQARTMAMPFPASDHGKVLKQLGKLNGTKFDRLYIDEMVRTQQADVANAEKVAPQAQDPVLKAWIHRQLPVMRTHVAKAGKALPGGAGLPKPPAA